MPQSPARNDSLFAESMRVANDYLLQFVVAGSDPHRDNYIQFAEAQAYVCRSHARTDFEQVLVDGLYDTIARLAFEYGKWTQERTPGDYGCVSP